MFTHNCETEIRGGNRRAYVRRMSENDAAVLSGPPRHKAVGILKSGVCFATPDTCKRTDSTPTKVKQHSNIQRHAAPSGLDLRGEGFALREDNESKHS